VLGLVGPPVERLECILLLSEEHNHLVSVAWRTTLDFVMTGTTSSQEKLSQRKLWQL